MLELKLVFPSTFRLSQIFFICCVDAAFCRHEPARGEVKQLRKSGSGRCSRDGRWDHRFSDFDFPQKSKPGWTILDPATVSVLTVVPGDQSGLCTYYQLGIYEQESLSS